LQSQPAQEFVEIFRRFPPRPWIARSGLQRRHAVIRLVAEKPNIVAPIQRVAHFLRRLVFRRHPCKEKIVEVSPEVMITCTNAGKFYGLIN
jgi:hypothetical protein